MHRMSWCLVLLLSALAVSARAQESNIGVEVHAEGKPVAEAAVTINQVMHVTNEQGVVVAAVAPGLVDIVIAKAGFAPTTISVVLTAGETRTITIDLEPQSPIEELVTVSATRTPPDSSGAFQTRPKSF